jgi:heme oxygenase
MTRAGYRDLLERFYGFYVPVEDRLATLWNALTPGFDYQPRRKAHLLRHDLFALGLSGQDIEALTLCVALPALDGSAQALGCAYVLEGATLGGQVIGRHLERVHGIDGHNGGAFFHSYGPHVGRMWREFGDALTAYSAHHAEEQEAIVAAAGDTFVRLEAWLCRKEPSGE